MTENARVLLAAELLVDRGFLAREADDRLVDLAVDGRGFRYLTSFWERVGALVPDAARRSWRSPLGGAQDMSETQLRVAVEWAAVGAPLEWARGEARAALEGFLRRLARGTWSDGSRSPEAPQGSAVRGVEGGEPGTARGRTGIVNA
jgi:hypothetical protein